MMMKYLLQSAILLGLLVLVTGCEEEDNSAELKEQEERYFDLYMGANFPDLAPSESGLYYLEISEGEGPSPSDEDWVLLDYVTYAIPSEKVLDSYIENVAEDNGLIADGTSVLFGPVKVNLENHVDGVREGISRMKVGGQTVLCMTSDLAYGSTGATLMENVPAYQSLKYEFELLEIIGDIESYEEARFAAYVDTLEGAVPIWDPDTDLYMYYVKTLVQPDSIDVIRDTVVNVAYTGYLFDGRVFDETDDDSYLPVDYPEEYVEGEGVIKGWDMALEFFRVGEKGTLIIPYQFAYGEGGSVSNGYISIPPYEPLLFDIEIISLSEDTDGTDPL